MSTAKVRLFARLAELAGTREADVELGEGLAAAGVFAALARQYPSIAAFQSTVRFAVNSEYVAGDHPIRPGDEVALIPPVSGGSRAV